MQQPQRTRHASLDFPRTSHNYGNDDDWGEFLSLSTSMLALAEDNNNAVEGLLPLSNANNNTNAPMNADDFSNPNPAFAAMTLRDTFSSDFRKMALATPPTPAPTPTRNWRPLGRRASAHVLPTSNQLEAMMRSNDEGRARRLKHAMSFAGVIKPQVTSPSSSSLVESSSSDEEQSDYDPSGTGGSNQEPTATFNATLDANAATTRYPALASLPPNTRSASANLQAAPPLVHAKSPVLSNRKDEQTWQLKEEELLSSPRYSFRSSVEEEVTARFDAGMSFLTDNQLDDGETQAPRVVKDTRASSADLTFSRVPEMNPPLPSPESLHKMRARSLSYSSTYGSPNFNASFSSKQYMPPGTTIQQDFPTTMRHFHAGPHPPPQSAPHPQGHRPPRVTIPAESPMHSSYHQQMVPPQPQLTRRYSTDFIVQSSYGESLSRESEPSQHRPLSNRGYSSEYMGFPSNPRSRSQSMEGNQLFASAQPPVEYPMMTRHNSYEWPRSPIAPPLPPDSHIGNGNGHSHRRYPSPPPEAYYEIVFKRGRLEVFAGDGGYNPGEYVKVEADRGEDIGKVVRQICEPTKTSNHDISGPIEESGSRNKRHDVPVKKIIAVASPREREMLQEQRNEEQEVFEVCKSKVRQRLLPMNVIDAEFQFDRHKLTFFFEADRRIDFRELVRDLFAIYKTRIWLQQVVPGSKKMMTECDTI